MSELRVGQGFDVHAYTAGEFVTLGGVKVPHTHGVLAHSDGDVLLHALCDALLGAAALGDIGMHFP
jgi:2-C-methyl-D-erythritol 2,4-cyclodiphosphate synthase